VAKTVVWLDFLSLATKTVVWLPDFLSLATKTIVWLPDFLSLATGFSFFADQNSCLAT
jgi:hypothetical protein